MNEAAVCQKLREHLDTLPGGFPPATEGKDIQLLERLFTPAEAEVKRLLAEANLVLNPTNSRFVSAICCCCGCCCGILHGLQAAPKPSAAVASSFIVRHEPDAPTLRIALARVEPGVRRAGPGLIHRLLRLPAPPTTRCTPPGSSF